MEKKKYENKRVERHMPLFYVIGLNVALLLTILAFEWKSPVAPVITHEPTGDLFKDYVDIPITSHPKKVVPPKAKKPTALKVDVPTKQLVESLLDEPTPEDQSDYTWEPDLPEQGIESIEVAEEPPIDFAEEMPTYPGGWDAFNKFLSKKIKYPSQARRMGIEGKVYVQFVVEKDGTLTGLKVVKGIGAGLDEEALRVMKLLDKFSPGMQSHRPVRVRMVLPIFYRLN